MAFGGKRSKALQRMAKMPDDRLQDLSSEIYFEMERRYPELKHEVSKFEIIYRGLLIINKKVELSTRMPLIEDGNSQVVSCEDDAHEYQEQLLQLDEGLNGARKVSLSICSVIDFMLTAS